MNICLQATEAAIVSLSRGAIVRTDVSRDRAKKWQVIKVNSSRRWVLNIAKLCGEGGEAVETATSQCGRVISNLNGLGVGTSIASVILMVRHVYGC
jgi:hypothetical protein